MVWTWLIKINKAQRTLQTYEQNKNKTMNRNKYSKLHLLWFGRVWGGTSGKPRDHLWTKIINAESIIFCSKWLKIVKVEGTFGDPDYWLLVVLFSHRRPLPLLLHCQPFVQTVIMTKLMMMILVVEQLWRWPHHRSPLASWLCQDQPPSRGQLVPHCSFLSALEHLDLMMRCLVALPDIVSQVTIFDQFSKAPGGEALPSLSPWLYTCTATSCQHVLVFLVWFIFSSFIPFYCLFWS